MTDTPTATPTQEEKDRALKTAKAWDTDPDFWHETAIELARCHLHATAELARAEERMALARKLLTGRAPFWAAGALAALDGYQDGKLASGEEETKAETEKRCRCQWVAGDRPCHVHDGYDKLARGESEETKMESGTKCDVPGCPEYEPPKFTPKPGDRVVLVSSPDPMDSELVGKVLTIDAVTPNHQSGPSFYWQCDEGGVRVYVARGAMFSPAPAKGRYGRCQRCGGDIVGPSRPKCGNCFDYDDLPGSNAVSAPAPAQAEQPPADASGVAAGEDAAEVLFKALCCLPGYRPGDGERADAAFAALDVLKQERQAHAAEVAELKRQADTATDMVSDLRQELEAEKAAHGRTKELYASALDCLKKAKDYGEAQREHALFASPPASPDTLPLRPAVAWFAQAMERKLRENDHKGGWLDDKCDLAFLLGKLTEERSELTRAIRERGTPEQCLDEAADVANIAMMIADVCQPVVREDGWDQPVDAAHWRSQQNQDSGSPGEAARDAAIVASEGSSPKESARSGDASLPKKKCRCASAALGSTCCDICEHDLSCPIHGDGTDCYGVAPVPEVADASLSTDRARLEAEGWCFEAPPPGEIGNWHDVLFCGKVYQGTYARLNYEQWCSSSSLMNWHEATLCAPGDVTAWRRAKPIAPSPDAGIEAVKAEVARLDGRVHALEDSVDRLFAQGKRLAELELQGSVTRKLAVAALLAPGPVSEKDIPDALARIERLEHERAGKAP